MIGVWFAVLCTVNDSIMLGTKRPAFPAISSGAKLAFYVVALPLTFIVVWLQVAYSPPIWVHLLTSVPLMVIGCVLPLRPIKGWLVASQYVNKSQEAGTEALWAKLHAQERKPD